MEVYLDFDQLNPAVGILRKTILKNEEFSSLSTIVFETSINEEYNLIVRSNNVEMGIQVRIFCEIKKEGIISINADIFYDLMRTLSNIHLNVKAAENSNLILKGTHFNALTTYLEYTENLFFNFFPDPKDLEFISVDKRKFIISIEKTLYSISDEDNYYNMSGVYFLPRNKNSEMVAVSMDGFRMSYIKFKYEIKNDKNNTTSYNKAVILTRKASLEVISLSRIKFLENLSYFEMAIGKKCLIARSYNVYLFIKTIDDEFPDYMNILNMKSRVNSRIKKNTLLTTIKRISSLSKEKKCSVLMEFRKKNITFFYYDLGIAKRGEINETLDIETGLTMTLLINTRFLLEAINSFDEEYIEMRLIDEYSPIFFSNEFSNHIALIMPIKGE